MLDFIKCFFCVIWHEHMIFLCSLLIWWIILIDFQVSNEPCSLGINTTWSLYNSFFIQCQIWFGNIFVEKFCICIGLWVLFLMISLSVFGIRVMLALWSEVRNILFASNFFKNSMSYLCLVLMLALPSQAMCSCLLACCGIFCWKYVMLDNKN